MIINVLEASCWKIKKQQTQSCILDCKKTNLVVVKDGVSEGVLPWNCVGPQLLHEEHLIGERGDDSCKVKYEY